MRGLLLFVATDQALQFQHQFPDSNRICLDFVEVAEGETIAVPIRLPEFWYSWRHQLRTHLAKASARG